MIFSLLLLYLVYWKFIFHSYFERQNDKFLTFHIVYFPNFEISASLYVEPHLTVSKFNKPLGRLLEKIWFTESGMKIPLVGVVGRFDVVGGVDDRSVVDISSEWLTFFYHSYLVDYFLICSLFYLFVYSLNTLEKKKN